ncbi:hypothetical protein HY3_15495 [Hyphomonas pacifica]|uniref:Uncharacterized protein n=1 Tax=Hyphomonas pacifica TaxID=1280941 RepID=A0A062U0W1_9PROT|nr:hypothetical protein HY2_14910 [Hyphomonas pacifica]RAN32200.1 hypothetical protein HY3_15495 [Hyphomonas pacifica]|tara:strand:- start:422 stop:544 length:123 start_codon:yes stop_codon:yes gene_type:complete
MGHKPRLVVGFRVLTRLDDIPAVAKGFDPHQKTPPNQAFM